METSQQLLQDIMRQHLVMGLVNLCVLIFMSGMIYQKIKTINGDVQYNKRWRHWATTKLVAILTSLGISSAGMPE